MFKSISLRIRIFLAMILLVLLASVLIVGVTVYQYDEETKEYNIDRFGRKEDNTRKDIDFELKRNLLENLTSDNLSRIFKMRIFEISSVHNLEISIYDLKGNLLISSTSTAFDKIDESVISPRILNELESNTNHRVFKNDEVENISFETSYTYLSDLKLNNIGVLKLEFSQDNTMQQKELNEFMYRLAYVYVFMFIIAIALAYFLSSYITRSIKTISDKIHETRLNKRNEKIEFNTGSTEIITLVNAYNRMIDELQESAVKLAQSEREQAWREMAKQVAHEIKNPLTPMRLTVQSFERRFDPEDPKIKEKLKEYSQTLIQQIDVMSSIASAFSDFAKMPKQNKEEINVVEVVKLALDIFNEDYISYSYTEDNLIANLDKTQLIRIVTNLITNATQATENIENPTIKVTVSSNKKSIKIAVIDNGKGIDDDVKDLIFEPKFTTKSSGMGLGLPMIKKIIEAYNGSIAFTSNKKEGTILQLHYQKNKHMTFENLLVSTENGLATITINRPKKLNALNKNTIEELHNAFKNLETDASVKAIIITGSGEKAFVAGADISEFAHFSVEEGGRLAAKGQEMLFDFVENLSTPVIAAVNGFALGGGLELAMSCHFRVASDNAKMGLPEVSLGVIPGYGGTQRLPQLIGKGRAMELVMTAGMISAEDAKNYGLVNHVTTQEELIPLATKIASKIMRNSSVAIGAAIKAVNDNFKDGVNGFETEISEFGACFGTEDFKEGTTAFLEKRRADFPGK